MRAPPRWSTHELKADASAARSAFRKLRLDEPLQRWIETFDLHKAQFERLLGEFGLGNPANFTARMVAGVFARHLDEALRYLTGPRYRRTI
ncbi:MAG: hypothetical protein JO166_08290 [Deltaproteobacteria bacterium]|nr:hypothetical protein [Deltaproteobacteria bacterium]